VVVTSPTHEESLVTRSACYKEDADRAADSTLAGLEHEDNISNATNIKSVRNGLQKIFWPGIINVQSGAFDVDASDDDCKRVDAELYSPLVKCGECKLVYI